MDNLAKQAVHVLKGTGWLLTSWLSPNVPVGSAVEQIDRKSWCSIWAREHGLSNSTQAVTEANTFLWAASLLVWRCWNRWEGGSQSVEDLHVIATFPWKINSSSWKTIPTRFYFFMQPFLIIPTPMVLTPFPICPRIHKISSLITSDYL